MSCVHIKRAKVFYDYCKAEVGDAISFCFDLQKMQQLPKTPIQEAFYSRQLALYVFRCCEMNSKNPVFYTWCEDQASEDVQKLPLLFLITWIL